MAVSEPVTDTLSPDEIEAFQAQLLEAATGTLNLFAIHLGHRLGCYEALANQESLTPGELAEATGIHVRYAREWLEHQAINGMLEVEDPTAPADERAYRIDPVRAHVLTERDSLDYLAPLIPTVVGATQPIDAVEEAYRTGGGVSFGEYGVHMRQGQEGLNRAMFLHELGSDWIPALPGMDDRLRSDPPARVADIGCGAGWSCIGLAQAYPKARVDGYDLDPASVELARRNVEDAGVEGRVRIHQADASDPDLNGAYDLVTAFECVHDMARPGEALATMRRLAGDDGAVLIADERVASSFADANEIEPLMYGWSVLHCLPAGRAEHPTNATGTVMRRPILESLAEGAGFSDLHVLPVENFFFRFYHLIP